MVQAQSWVLEEPPGALSLKCWTQAPREVLALRSLDLGTPEDLGSRAKACLLGKISEEQSWRPWWADVIMQSWSYRKPEHSKRNQEKRDQCLQMEQGHQEQVRADRYILCALLGTQEGLGFTSQQGANIHLGLVGTLPILLWS